MERSRIAMGLASAVPAVLIGAAMTAIAAQGLTESPTWMMASAALVFGGVALAIVGLSKGARPLVLVGSLLMAVGSAPVLLPGLGVLVLLSALFLVWLSGPAVERTRLLHTARLVTALGALALAFLTVRHRERVAELGPTAALLWLALVLLVGYAWWPRPGLASQRENRAKLPSPRERARE